jgi:hypothetical protein
MDRFSSQKNTLKYITKYYCRVDLLFCFLVHRLYFIIKYNLVHYLIETLVFSTPPRLIYNAFHPPALAHFQWLKQGFEKQFCNFHLHISSYAYTREDWGHPKILLKFTWLLLVTLSSFFTLLIFLIDIQKVASKAFL